MKKKLIAVVLALVVSLFVAMPAMAATADEVMAKLGAIPGIDAYLDDAQAWLTANADNYTAAELDVVAANVDAAAATIAANGGDLAAVPAADRGAILANIQAAADAVGLQAVANGSVVTVVDAGGAAVVSAVYNAAALPVAENPIKATGHTANFTAIAIVAVALVSMFVVALVMGSKRKASLQA